MINPFPLWQFLFTSTGSLFPLAVFAAPAAYTAITLLCRSLRF